MSFLEDELSSWQETVYLLSNPRNAEHLRKSMRELDSGGGVEYVFTADGDLVRKVP